MPSHVVAALQRMWWEVEKDPRWQPYLPPGGLMGAAREVLRRLERAPVRAQVKDDKTGETAPVVLGKEDFQLYFVDGGPRHLISLHHEQYDEWAREALARRRSREAELLLIGSLIDTSLEVFAILLEFVETGNAAKLPARVTMPIRTFAPPKFPLPVSKPPS
jgi:hypothetical protein